MGKAVSFVLACGSLGILAIALVSRAGSPLEDAGLLAGFVVLSTIAWLIALATAVYHALRFGRGWAWVAVLVALLWVPTLPALAFGLSGLFVRRSRQPRRARQRAAHVNPADVLVSWQHALKDEVHA
jgi:hypothetical protein